ncbi:uncharacterized protein LOC126839970 [Adelges cooleyi]|uniref:uncharacterized protein LOC126839970 n=1 Tax=Adelges cooleyi TaxID=133065 RepID=UPI0021808259|nr:uncharacterized protein LOC126839970 [Adelges cooleyi]XP_050431404.1 uncharacterized protein LOC126839970 [Adelges cooleyi]
MHTCKECSKEFTFQRNLSRHLKNKHNISSVSKRAVNGKEAKHTCPVCHLMFVERSSLRRHERKKHDKNITKSLTKEKSEKFVNFEQSNLEDYPILKNLIPSKFVYRINQVKNIDNTSFQSKFEIADCTEDKFYVWLSELEKKSGVTYRVKSFTKSISLQIVFNKVYRCVHNTFPSKHCIPHPKHTGCQATLTVRIKKCNEILSVKSSITENNNMILLKAIITLNHCHNHSLAPQNSNNIISQSLKFYNRSLNTIHSKQALCQNLTFDNSKLLVEENNDSIENIIINDYESCANTLHDNKQSEIDESDEYDDYILVENVDFQNSTNYEKNEINQLLSDYDSMYKNMSKQFESNPEYFKMAIKSFNSAMKKNIKSKETLLETLHVFGKNSNHFT